jgi:hypothetical protein
MAFRSITIVDYEKVISFNVKRRCIDIFKAAIKSPEIVLCAIAVPQSSFILYAALKCMYIHLHQLFAIDFNFTLRQMRAHIH